jgi:hypothetical protein
VDTKKIQPPEMDKVLQTAKKKNKCVGTLNMPESDVLNADPVGSFPSSLAAGLKKVAKSVKVKLQKVKIKGEEEQTAPPGAPGEQEAQESEGQEADPGQALQQRLETFLPKYQQAIAVNTPHSTALQGLFGKCKAAMEAQNYKLANQILDAMEQAVVRGGPPPAPPSQKAPQTPPSPLSKNEIAFRKVWSAAKNAWRNASDTVDGQITQLQTALRQTEDSELHDIAETGLNAVTGDYKVPLMAGMFDLDQATGPRLKKAADKVKTLVTAFKAYLDREPAIAACDQNPFEVTVTIRKSLGAALEQMDKVLAAAPK